MERRQSVVTGADNSQADMDLTMEEQLELVAGWVRHWTGGAAVAEVEWRSAKDLCQAFLDGTLLVQVLQAVRQHGTSTATSTATTIPTTSSSTSSPVVHVLWKTQIQAVAMENWLRAAQLVRELAASSTQPDPIAVPLLPSIPIVADQEAILLATLLELVNRFPEPRDLDVMNVAKERNDLPTTATSDLQALASKVAETYDYEDILMVDRPALIANFLDFEEAQLRRLEQFRRVYADPLLRRILLPPKLATALLGPHFSALVDMHRRNVSAWKQAASLPGAVDLGKALLAAVQSWAPLKSHCISLLEAREVLTQQYHTAPGFREWLEARGGLVPFRDALETPWQYLCQFPIEAFYLLRVSDHEHVDWPKLNKSIQTAIKTMREVLDGWWKRRHAVLTTYQLKFRLRNEGGAVKEIGDASTNGKETLFANDGSLRPFRLGYLLRDGWIRIQGGTEDPRIFGFLFQKYWIVAKWNADSASGSWTLLQCISTACIQACTLVNGGFRVESSPAGKYTAFESSDASDWHNAFEMLLNPATASSTSPNETIIDMTEEESTPNYRPLASFQDITNFEYYNTDPTERHVYRKCQEILRGGVFSDSEEMYDIVRTFIPSTKKELPVPAAAVPSPSPIASPVIQQQPASPIPSSPTKSEPPAATTPLTPSPAKAPTAEVTVLEKAKKRSMLQRLRRMLAKKGKKVRERLHRSKSSLVELFRGKAKSTSELQESSAPAPIPAPEVVPTLTSPSPTAVAPEEEPKQSNSPASLSNPSVHDLNETPTQSTANITRKQRPMSLAIALHSPDQQGPSHLQQSVVEELRKKMMRGEGGTVAGQGAMGRTLPVDTFDTPKASHAQVGEMGTHSRITTSPKARPVSMMAAIPKQTSPTKTTPSAMSSPKDTAQQQLQASPRGHTEPNSPSLANRADMIMEQRRKRLEAKQNKAEQ